MKKMIAFTIILFCVIVAVFYLPISNPKNLFFTYKQVDRLEKRVDSLENRITIIEQKYYDSNK